jgi:hypothetical protein
MTRVALIVLSLVASSCASSLTGLYRSTLATPWEQAQYVAPARDGCEQGLATLEARAAAMKLPVDVADLGPNTMGTFWHDEWRIEVNVRLRSCGRLEVLAHELGHALAPPILSGSAAGQVYADAVSYLAVRQLAGYDPRDVYARYLASRKIAAPTLLLYEQDIERAAEWLVHGGSR